MSDTTLVLASTSVYRAELLGRLGIPFRAVRPPFEEEIIKNKLLAARTSPVEIAEQLSRGKANSIARAANETVIAGDQLVQFNDRILGKSENFTQACKQLREMQGTSHDLVTAVTVVTPRQTFHLNHVTTLLMRPLSDQEIENYLKIDTPFDCAGSYKIEKSGIALFAAIKTDDFTAIQGLPLIWLSKTLKEIGYELFKS